MSPSVVGSGVPHPTIVFINGIPLGSEYTQQPQPFQQDIDRRIDIPVVPCSTDWANPHPDSQVLHVGVLAPAAAAQLTAGEECADLHDLFVLPGSLILQLPAELTPGGIRYGLCQGVIFHHSLDVEAFHADDVVVPDQLGGQLVEIVIPLICDLLMEPSLLRLPLQRPS